MLRRASRGRGRLWHRSLARALPAPMKRCWNTVTTGVKEVRVGGVTNKSLILFLRTLFFFFPFFSCSLQRCAMCICVCVFLYSNAPIYKYGCRLWLLRPPRALCKPPSEPLSIIRSRLFLLSFILCVVERQHGMKMASKQQYNCIVFPFFLSFSCFSFSLSSYMHRPPKIRFG